MSFLQFRDDYKDALEVILKKNRLVVETVGGRIDETELKRMAKKSGVYIALVTFSPAGNAGISLRDYTIGMIAFIACKKDRQTPKEDVALIINNYLVEALERDDFKLGHKRPQKITGANLFNSSIDRTGLALWSVTWQQEIRIDLANIDGAADLAGIDGEYFLTDPADDGVSDATDTINFEND